MTKEWLDQKIKEAHASAVEKGFYPEGEDKNIGELLMSIVSELGKALEAHRCGRFAEIGKFVVFVGNVDIDTLVSGLGKGLAGAMNYYTDNVKDSFEDLITNVFIRLFDLCGYLEIKVDEEVLSSTPYIGSTVGECFLKLSYEISFLGRTYENYLNPNNYSFMFAYLRDFCQYHNIPIKKHIEAKMAYNSPAWKSVLTNLQ
jgi:hypothetical protein